MKDCYSLLSNNNFYKKAIVEDCDMYFDETEYKFFSHVYRFNQILEVHKLCYSIIEKETKIKLKYSDVDWKSIIGMRTYLAHAYHRIDSDIVWKAASISVPALVKALKKTS